MSNKLIFVITAILILAFVGIACSENLTVEQVYQARRQPRKGIATPTPASTVIASNVVQSRISSAARPEPAAGIKQLVADAKTNPPAQKNKKDYFHEFNAYAGGWYAAEAKSRGYWTQLELVRWFRSADAPDNFGLGLTFAGDYGKARNGYDWGYLAVGPNFDYYRQITLNDGFLLKLRPLYRWSKSPKGDNWMPGLYADYYHKVGPRNKLVFSVDGHYFRNDSYGALTAQWETSPVRNVRIRLGMSLYGNFLQDENVLGWGPVAQIKFYDRFVIGASINFAHLGPFFGGYVGYELNTDLMELSTSIRERNVELKNAGIANSDIEVTRSGQTINQRGGE